MNPVIVRRAQADDVDGLSELFIDFMRKSDIRQTREGSRSV